MGLFGLLKRAANQRRDAAEIVAFYERLRPVRLRLNNELVGRLSRDVLDEGGKKIGILRRGVFVFDNEDESSVLMDYCIYDVYRGGRNAIGQYLQDHSPDPESDEMACLQAMRDAKYALVLVTGIEPGVGCHIRNLFTDETRLLVDMGFSQTARPGVLLATRLLDFGAFVTTTGAALPLGVLNGDESEAWQRKLSTGVYDEGEDPAALIRGCLERGASSHVRYENLSENRLREGDRPILLRGLRKIGTVPDGSRIGSEGSTPSRWCDDREDHRPAGAAAQQRRALAKRGSSKSAGNRRCRCGSGKMFKNCCGKRAPQGQEGR